MNFNEELAVAGALELTDSELETALGGWGGRPEYEYVWPYGWVLVSGDDFEGGWGRGGWGRGGWGRGDWDRGGWDRGGHGGHGGHGDHDGR